jgi:hypothetical protein
VSGDKLVVGYQEFVRTVAFGLEATDTHGCQEQDGVDYEGMAKTLWASGYRFDPEARTAWLIVELRANATKEQAAYLNELLGLLGVEA